METATMLTVGGLAELAGVSVRTLHHYDDIELLRASRNEAGYRVYDEDAVVRLHQILVMRELGLPLEVIRRTLDDADFDTEAALQRQLTTLDKKIGQLENVRSSVEAMLSRMRRGTTMSNSDIADVFGGFDPSEHEAEAEERWGDSDAFRESTRRTQRYSKSDWEQIKAESDSIETDFADALEAGRQPNDPAVVAIAERHRVHIDRWFYPCPYSMHTALAEMYVGDKRFTDHYDTRRSGLAQYVHDAIRANAAEL